MEFAPNLAGVLGVASGIAVALLGLTIANLRHRSVGSLSFAAAAFLWGAAVAAGNLASISGDAATAAAWLRLMVVLYVPLYVPILLFVSYHPRRAGPLARSALTRSLIAVPGIAALLALAIQPALGVERVFEANGHVTGAEYGPLFFPVIHINSILVFVVAVWTVLLRLRETRSPTQRGQLGLLAAGFLVYVSYRAAPADLATMVGANGGTAATIQWLGTLGAFAAVATAAWTVWRTPAHPWRRLLLAAALIPFLAGLVELGLVATGAPASQSSVGAWRIVAVGLFAYAMARFQLFDVDLRMRRTLHASLLAGILIAGFFVASELLERLLPFRSLWLNLLATGLLALALRPVEHFARGVATRTFHHAAQPHVLADRKLEVFRGALEAAALDGVVTAKERHILARLQADLDIDAQAARALERDVLGGLGMARGPRPATT